MQNEQTNEQMKEVYDSLKRLESMLNRETTLTQDQYKTIELILNNWQFKAACQANRKRGGIDEKEYRRIRESIKSLRERAKRMMDWSEYGYR
jgi:CRISPR/Cas system CSM-associated protein Csm2 small subunit